MNAKSGEVDALGAPRWPTSRAWGQARRPGDRWRDENEDIESRREEAQRQIEALNGRIDALEEELAGIDAGRGPWAARRSEALRQQIAELTRADRRHRELQTGPTRPPLLEDPESLNAQYAQAQAGLAQIDAGIAQIDATLDKLEQGIIPGGYIEGIDEDTKLSDAKAQLEAARKQADSGFAQASQMLATARRSWPRPARNSTKSGRRPWRTPAWTA